uniref:Uncharacterized protein n=1 Tax=Lygus hesperus TaxID=30085 RepID=A0A146KKJ5_LYGHE
MEYQVENTPTPTSINANTDTSIDIREQYSTAQSSNQDAQGTDFCMHDNHNNTIRYHTRAKTYENSGQYNDIYSSNETSEVQEKVQLPQPVPEPPKRKRGRPPNHERKRRGRKPKPKVYPTRFPTTATAANPSHSNSNTTTKQNQRCISSDDDTNPLSLGILPDVGKSSTDTSLASASSNVNRSTLQKPSRSLFNTLIDDTVLHQQQHQ